MAGVDEAIDKCPAPFVAGLITMPALGQRDIAEELVVGVNAAASVAAGGAQGAAAAGVRIHRVAVFVGQSAIADGNERQTQIVRRKVGRQGIQAVGRFGIDANILGQELLQEPVVPAAHLEDQIRPWNRCIGQRHDVDVCGRKGIEARRAGTGEQHAQREALHAVGVEIAPGKQVFGAEELQVLIGLDDSVVAYVAERSGVGHGVSRCGQ